MEIKAAPDAVLEQLSAHISETMGLHFAPERWMDLQRGLAGAAKEFGYADAGECAAWLMSGALSKAQTQVLAQHLTIGETYFFREPRTFEALTASVLPELIRTRRESGRRLRVWSAACCTGEEPYSLAILLSQMIPDIADWHITILATDLNQRFLKKAVAGVYSEWSFRDAPPWLKDRYFRRTPDRRYALRSEIKARVTFAQLNLVDDVFPSLATNTNAMDLIFCRNALMYFSRPQFEKAIRNLRGSLVEGGWLAVSPSEVAQALYPGFKTVSFPGATLYRKSEAKTAGAEPRPAPVEFVVPDLPTPEPWLPAQPLVSPPLDGSSNGPNPPASDSMKVAAQYYEEGRYAEAAETLLSAGASPRVPAEYSLLARALANLGELSEALEWCDRWLAEDKLDASGHYLRAVVLQELGDPDPARQALQRAIYLQPEMVLAHFALGNLARTRDEGSEAERHFANALRVLRPMPPDELLPEADGLTAGRLTEIITSLLATEVTP